MESKSPLVSICCAVYNHGPYIRQCLEGFVMQKCNFKFEVLIHDDASTDNTADIIREYESKYPDIIKPIFQTENQYSKGVKITYTYNYPRVRGKYVAMCEGDDYWTDPYKLQKQVDFLQSHADYGLVRTNVDFYYQSENRFQPNYFSDGLDKKIKDTHKDYILYGWFNGPCTYLYRKDFIEYIYKYCDSRYSFFKGNLLLILLLTQTSKIKYMECSTAVYRVLNKSASHFETNEEAHRFWNSVYDLRAFFARKQSFFFRLKFFLLTTKSLLYYYKQNFNIFAFCKEWFQKFNYLFLQRQF